MQNNNKVSNIQKTEIDIVFETSRWTSGAYEVQFGQIGIVEANPEQAAPFQLSAWGLSKDLRELLGDYSDTDVSRAVEWMMLQQTRMVVHMLEQITIEQGFVPPLENLFISVEGELFLARGLKLLVVCITNIVPCGNENEGLDKFVAVLDPGEARNYIEERQGLSSTDSNEILH
jgi:hypothetical protein